MKKYIIALVVTVLVIAGVAVYSTRSSTETQRSGGTTNLDGLTLASQLITGGVRATSTVNAAETLLQSDLTGYSLVSVTPNRSTGVTLTLPATSTLTSLLPLAGDTLEISFYNATSTVGTNVGLIGGTGWNMSFVATSTSVTAATSTKLHGFVLKAVRLSNTDVAGIVSQTQ